MKKFLFLSVILLSSFTSCSKRPEEIEVTQDYSDFQEVDENQFQDEFTPEEEYRMQVRVIKRTYYV